jgi:hypothetical protein
MGRIARACVSKDPNVFIKNSKIGCFLSKQTRIPTNLALTTKQKKQNPNGNGN